EFRRVLFRSLDFEPAEDKERPSISSAGSKSSAIYTFRGPARNRIRSSRGRSPPRCSSPSRPFRRSGLPMRDRSRPDNKKTFPPLQSHITTRPPLRSPSGGTASRSLFQKNKPTSPGETEPSPR